MATGQAKAPGRPAREVWRRWTPKLTQDGWTPVSDFFLSSYRRLGISTPEAMLVIQIMRHKWDEKHPFPSFATLAERMGISDTAARGHARSLECKGFVLRINRVGKPNLFDFAPLFARLEQLKDEDLAGAAEDRADEREFVSDYLKDIGLEAI